MKAVIQVVVADDSPFVCRLLTTYFQSCGDIEVVGTALNGRRAVQQVEQLRPSVVTMDLEMPGTNGLEAVGEIMQRFPTPVVVISGVSGRAATMTLQALDLGAVDFILKFAPGMHTDPEGLRDEIVAKVRAAAKVRVIRSLHSRREAEPVRSGSPVYPAGKQAEDSGPDSVPGGIVILGASTGGPLVLRQILAALPNEFSAGLIVVQHIPPTFTSVLAAQLDRYTALHVREAQDGDAIQPGVVLVAPGGSHLLVRPGPRVELHPGAPIDGHCPSIDVTMQSAAQVYGPAVTGVVLTGMGRDGSNGLMAIHGRSGRTCVQSVESCVVSGMPESALLKGAAQHVAPPEGLARFLVESASERRLNVC